MKTLELIAPSGDAYVIRETTGDDDDVLSNPSFGEADMINTYLSGIIMKAGPKGDRLTPAGVEKMKLRDKYYILVRSRMFSLGEILYFQHAWGPGEEPSEYEWDLKQFAWTGDWKDFPQPGDPDYHPERIAPYEVIEPQLTLSSGSNIRFELLDGVGEKYLLTLKPNQMTINKQLVARKFEENFDGVWKGVKSFGSYTSAELTEVRNYLQRVDPMFRGIVTIRDAFGAETREIPLLSIRDFYFPVKT